MTVLPHTNANTLKFASTQVEHYKERVAAAKVQMDAEYFFVRNQLHYWQQRVKKITGKIVTV